MPETGLLAKAGSIWTAIHPKPKEDRSMSFNESSKKCNAFPKQFATGHPRTVNPFYGLSMGSGMTKPNIEQEILTTRRE